LQLFTSLDISQTILKEERIDDRNQILRINL
jgi:hypothetical protein